MLCPDGFTLVIPLVFLVSSTLCCSGRVILHLSPTYLLVSSTLSVLWPHELYTCLPLVPLVSQSALSSADVSSAYSGYTWPDVFTLIYIYLSSPLVSLLFLLACLLASDYSGYTWPELSLACLQVRFSDLLKDRIFLILEKRRNTYFPLHPPRGRIFV